MNQPSDEGLHPTPAAVFAAWLARREAGAEADFEALCRGHPALAGELLRLHGDWAKAEALRSAHRHDGSLAEKIARQFGSAVDPQVTLAGEEPAASDFSPTVLARIAERGALSTRYRVQGEVAQGGMGTVLRVWDEDLRRHLAMKVMLGKAAPHEEGAAPRTKPRQLARFLEEAQVTGQLDHPGIVPVHELGLDAEGHVYFTMKLVKGQTLKEVFDELARGAGGWTQARALGLLLKLCEAMSYAHAKGVIHRDLKPANVMVGRFGEVFVMDWGLAKILGRDDKKDIRIQPDPGPISSALRSARRDAGSDTPDSPLHTMDGDIVGTPAYMPPEQARGDLAAMGPHSDVYAVGAMLYHLLCGHMPYVAPDTRASNYAVWRWVLEGPPKALDRATTHAPVELVAICEKAMARDPAARYPDMAALSADLAAYVEGRVVSAYETGTLAETKKWVQRNRPLAAALAAAILAVALGGAGFAVKAEQATRAAELANEKASEAQHNLQLAERNAADAKEQQQRAEGNERLAREETAKVLRLADVKVLQELQRETDDLWPPYPDKIPALESWLARASDLASRLSPHRQTLAEMRAAAHAWSSAERVHDRETHPRAAELAQKQAELTELVDQLENDPAGQAQGSEERAAALEQEVNDLTSQVESRKTWTFDSAEQRWQHDVLAELVDGLEVLAAELLQQDATTPGLGWSIPKRLDFARRMEAGFRSGGEYAGAWNEALPSIRASYPGLDADPWMGLVPIGADPRSGLWEFAHLLTGVPAQRDADGELLLTEETGVVLVLLRGGTCWIGAQARDPQAPNYDPQARQEEGPVHEVEISPFLLSKFEMTQGQWLRPTGTNPSEYQSDRFAPTLLHPVECVSWDQCFLWLARGGLTLPSEAQWEYAARAGTETPWWTGAERESLSAQRAANLADQSAQRAGMDWEEIEDWLELDDGYAMHAPVGVYAPNAFGLHDVIGNVLEWPLDGYASAFYRKGPRRDPVAAWLGSPGRMPRGGSYDRSALLSRVASRLYCAPSNALSMLGVRPAMNLPAR